MLAEIAGSKNITSVCLTGQIVDYDPVCLFMLFLFFHGPLVVIVLLLTSTQAFNRTELGII